MWPHVPGFVPNLGTNFALWKIFVGIWIVVFFSLAHQPPVGLFCEC